jgi:hypothetical protein
VWVVTILYGLLMPSPTPSNLSQAIEVALAHGEAAPVVSWDGDTGAAFVVLRHRDGEEEWMAGFRLVSTSAHAGEWRATDFALHQVQPSGAFGVTGKTIRSLPIGDLLTSARKAISSSRTGTPAPGSGLRLMRIDRLAAFKTDARGKAPRDDRAYAELALEYSFIVEDGNRSPVKALAAREGGSAGTWANRIAEARRRGFLTPVKPGEAGGGITEAALRLLGWDPEEDERIDAQIAEEEAAQERMDSE